MTYDKINKKDAEIASLQQKVAGKTRGQAADDKLKASLIFANKLCKKYIELNYPVPTTEPVLKPCSFSAWKRLHEGESPYFYPEDEGYSIIRLQSMCYGRGACPPIFIYGEDIWSKKQIKLRFYQSRYFVGIPPKNPYAQPDSLWFVGYSKATDGAMALMFAMPMIKQPTSNRHNKKSGEYSIDELIDAANRYIDESAPNRA